MTVGRDTGVEPWSNRESRLAVWLVAAGKPRPWSGGLRLPPNYDSRVRQTTETVEAASGTPLDRLSKREQEVLDLASHGSTNSEIGERLGLTVHAVKFHLASIYRKLGVANRTEAAAAFLTGVVAAPAHTDEEAG